MLNIQKPIKVMKSDKWYENNNSFWKQNIPNNALQWLCVFAEVHLHLLWGRRRHCKLSIIHIVDLEWWTTDVACFWWIFHHLRLKSLFRLKKTRVVSSVSLTSSSPGLLTSITSLFRRVIILRFQKLGDINRFPCYFATLSQLPTGLIFSSTDPSFFSGMLTCDSDDKYETIKSDSDLHGILL